MFCAHTVCVRINTGNTHPTVSTSDFENAESKGELDPELVHKLSLLL